MAPSPMSAGWPSHLQSELQRNLFNPRVGTRLLSASDRVRVWEVRLRPGERLGFHRHVLDYFWTALSPGKAQSHINGGPAQTASYSAGQTQHLKFGPGEFMLHDLENVGSTDLVFVTVEFLQSANQPLSLPPGVTPRGLDASVLS